MPPTAAQWRASEGQPQTPLRSKEPTLSTNPTGMPADGHSQQRQGAHRAEADPEPNQPALPIGSRYLGDQPHVGHDSGTASLASPAVRCPHCGREVQLDEAIAHQLAAPMRAGWEAEMRQRIGEEVRAGYASELDAQHAEREELEGRLRERDGQIKELKAQEAGLLRDRRKLEDEKEDLEREKERARDEIRKQERVFADRRASQRAEEELRRERESYQEQLRRKEEEHGTRTRQLEDQLKRVSAQLEEAQRKSSTSLRQQEGIARQDLFGEELQRRFPADLIKVTPAGKRGPDAVQVVRIGHLDCGVISWECKRTAAWSNEWPRKLASEVRKARARFGVIVSEVLPPGMDGSGQAGDVWACDYGHAWDLAAGLRQAIIAVYRHEAANAARAGIAGRVYDYIATGGFEARYKAAEQAVGGLRQELGQDQRASQQRWRRMERLIDEILEQGLHGIVLDIIGLGGEIPPAARAELLEDGPPELPPGQGTQPVHS